MRHLKKKKKRKREEDADLEEEREEEEEGERELEDSERCVCIRKEEEGTRGDAFFVFVGLKSCPVMTHWPSLSLILVAMTVTT